MALYFDANTQHVDHGSASTLDNITAGTIMAWAMYESLLGDQCICTKAGAGGANLSLDIMSDGNLNFWQEQGSYPNQGAARSNDTPASVSTWFFCAATFDESGSDSDHKLYYGELGVTAAEVGGYSKQQVGSGSLDDSSYNFRIAAWEPTSPWWNSDHHVAMLGLWPSILTLSDIRRQQRYLWPVIPGSRVFTNYGWNGTGTQRDWSGNGNHGTITGSPTVKPHPGLGPIGYDVPVKWPISAAPPTAASLLPLLGVG